MIIERKLEKNIKQWLGRQEYILINGSRRTGKTTLLKAIMSFVQTKKAFLICDDLAISEKISHADDLIFRLKQEYQFSKNEAFTLFLDEFQHLKNAGLLLKNLYDQYPKLQVIASGSSSLEITANQEFLTGRAIAFVLHPFSFAEYLASQSKTFTTLKSLRSFNDYQQFYRLYKSDLDQHFMTFLRYGSYPQIALEHDEARKEELLKNYVKSYIEKDVVNFLKVENVQAFNHLLRLMAAQVGNLLNVNEITNTLGIAQHTALKYLDILEGSYVLERVRPFYRNIRSELSKMPKVYFWDIGLRNSLLMKHQAIKYAINLGQEVENFVFNVLQQNQFKVNFHRTVSASEIDFLIESDHEEKILIEVKYSDRIKEPLAFRNFAKKYPKERLRKIVISKSKFERSSDLLTIPASIFALLDFQLLKEDV